MTQRDSSIFRASLKRRWEILSDRVVWHTIVTRSHSTLELNFQLLEGKLAEGTRLRLFRDTDGTKS